MFKFKEEIKNPSISGKVPKQFLNEDGDYNCEKAIIEWTLDFEMREFGVKDTYIYIKKITLIFDDFDYGEYECVLDDKDQDFTTHKYNGSFRLISKWYDREDFKWLTIFPVEIYIDFDNEEVEVEF